MNSASTIHPNIDQNPVAGRGSAQSARPLIRRAKQASRRKFPAEEKIRILLEGIRGEVSVSELCRREGIHPTIYYKRYWILPEISPFSLDQFSGGASRSSNQAAPEWGTATGAIFRFDIGQNPR